MATTTAAPQESPLISVFDLFRVGIGPSSSHTVGPMRAARRFVRGLEGDGLLARVAAVEVELFGSLAATCTGHGTDKAVLLGLAGEEPGTVDIATADERFRRYTAEGRVPLPGARAVRHTLLLHPDRTLPAHPNALTLTALDRDGDALDSRTFHSVGGGFLLGEDTGEPADVPHPFDDADQLLQLAGDGRISDLMLANECARRPESEVRARLLHLWDVMRGCVERGCRTEGVLPGGLNVPRRAPALHRRLTRHRDTADPLHAMDWVALHALAVNEENAAGGRVVTAPTNGAAGIVPAVLLHYHRCVPGADDDHTVRFLLAAAAIGSIVKRNASISGAEVGCQGEIGTAAAMAAAGLTELLGGTPGQVENAAEIALEHHLGLTCDPVAGLVQIPCIERNAIGSLKAITAARLSLHGDGTHLVPLDAAIRAMRDTGADMSTKYKETARGGLALSFAQC
ncbi:L-serine ammonia-lyase [Kitasatospora sp. NPDC048540]|uniref:L-serine ammonia-lyase n=1 Tax=Kitasatospora sp. NPDC048540 TaxID=3155634 RepID=UPI00340598D9